MWLELWLSKDMSTTTATKSFTFCNMMSGNTEFALHRTGCADLRRHAHDYNGTWSHEAENARQALAEEFGSDSELAELGWTADDCRVFPCCDS